MADLMLKLFQLLLCFASNAMQFARQTPDRNRIYTIGPPLPTLITKANIYIRGKLNSILNYGRCKNKQISLIRVALLEGSVNNDLLVNYDADIINKY